MGETKWVKPKVPPNVDFEIIKKLVLLVFLFLLFLVVTFLSHVLLEPLPVNLGAMCPTCLFIV